MMGITCDFIKSVTKLLCIFWSIPLFLVAQVNSSESVLSVSKNLKTHDSLFKKFASKLMR